MSKVVTEQTIIAKNNQIIANEIDDELVMMSLEQGNYYSLNPVAKRIWELVETPMSVAQICSVLQQEYEVDYPNCLSSVLSFSQKMEAEGLLSFCAEKSC